MFLGFHFAKIVGHLIPAGTGMRKFVDLLVGSQDEFDALAESREKAASRKKKELA